MELPKPTWKPARTQELEHLLRPLSLYTAGSRAVVIFAHGTAVFSDTAMHVSDEDYKARLRSAVTQAPDFTVRPMEDGNFLIRFRGSVCGLVLADFLAEHREEIVSGIEKGGLLPGELLLQPGTAPTPVDHYYCGLLARAWLYHDAEVSKIVLRSP